MDFQHSDHVRALQDQLNAFMDRHVYPVEKDYEIAEKDAMRDGLYHAPAILEELKAKAKEQGLWNLFLPRAHGDHGAGLTNLEYAPLAEIMGRVHFASEVFNCAAPDTGNMETIERYGTAEHKARWLQPLLAGEIRSAFLMTEPAVASSDATNIATRIVRDGDHYVINGRKWWSSGAGDPRCRILIVMGVTTPEAEPHARHAMVLVPMDTPGLRVVRLPVGPAILMRTRTHPNAPEPEAPAEDAAP